jgi:Fe2+ transport system protein FeoA
MKSLVDLHELEIGKIISLDSKALGVDFTRDLLDYGFIPGAKIQLKKKQASSDKIILTVGQTDIAIRSKDAAFIEVSTDA